MGVSYFEDEFSRNVVMTGTEGAGMVFIGRIKKRYSDTWSDVL